MYVLEPLLRCVTISAAVGCLLASNSAAMRLPASVLFMCSSLLIFLRSEVEIRAGVTRKFSIERSKTPIRFWSFVVSGLALALFVGVVGVCLFLPIS